MWIRKSDTEISDLLNQKEIEKKSLRRPIIFGTIFGLLFMIIQYLGFRGGTRGYYLFTSHPEFSWKTLYLGVFGFTLFFALAIYHQKRGSALFSGNKFFRCRECTEIFSINAENLCQCGGRLEPSEFYTWEEA